MATIHDKLCPDHYFKSLCLDFLTIIVWGENTLKGLELPGLEGIIYTNTLGGRKAFVDINNLVGFNVFIL